jgi:hypothetical protein
MNSMRPTRLTMKLPLAAVVGLALGAALTAMSAPARAADGETFESKLLQQFMEGIGLQKGGGSDITYQERAPLVIPPRLDLPPPDTDTAAKSNPAWPVDPDVKRAKAAAEAARKQAFAGSEAIDMEGRRLLPSELGPRTRPRAGTVVSNSPEESERRFMPSELGYKGGLFGSLFGGSKDSEQARFTQEPPRASLTDPPPGYQTPSPAQPYGLSGKENAPKAYNVWDRGTDKSQ